MDADWPSVPLGELVDPQRGVSYGIVQPGSPVPDGVPIVRVSDVRNGRIDVQSPLRVTPDIERAYGRTRLRGGELLITIVGTVGETAIVPPDMAGWNVARAIAVLPVNPDVGPYWVQLGLRSSAAVSMIQSRLNTTVQATLNLGDLARLPIVLPPPHERHGIASVLGALDDKIELNRRMNETLEAMARAIFKDWFVDFGPTRAKMEGRAPYLAPDIWSLFPDRLDEEGKPGGWTQNPFKSLIADQIGGDWGDEAQTEEHRTAVRIVRGTDLRDLASGTIGKVPQRFTSDRKLESRRLADLDVLIEVSGGSPTQPTGRSLLITQSMLERFSEPVTFATFCRRFRPLSRDHAIIAAAHLSHLYAKGGTWEYQNQSTGISNFQTQHFLNSELVVWPGAPLASAFAYIVEPMLRKSTSNEGITLAGTRDFLLPKLMSGEVRVKDAEKLIGEMA
jgi:type I restriction enzyme S subunit